MSYSQYLIIGNSTAAVAAMEAIRKEDLEGTLTVISDEKYSTYSRPLISYLLEEKTTVEKMRYRDEGFYERLHIRTLFGIRAEKLDTQKREVRLADGSIESYDKLLLATGSVPFLPPTEGCPEVNCGKGAYTFIKLDDALALQKRLTPESQVVVVGGGLTGVKATEGILHLTKKITLVELAPRVLPVALDEMASQMVQKRLEAAGVTVCCGTSVTKVSTDEAGNVCGVKLSDGREVACDTLVLSIGVRPNLSLVQGTEIQVARGICIDECGRTSVPDVFAAGDCVESVDLTDHSHRILAILPNAYAQGKVAGTVMAGGERTDCGTFPLNATRFLGLPIISAGITHLTEEQQKTRAVEVVLDWDDENYRKLLIADDRLIGFLLMGVEATKRAGILTALLREQKPLSTLQKEIRQTQPEMMLFDKKQRTEMLYAGIR